MLGAEKEDGKCSQLEDGKVECCEHQRLSRFPKVGSEFKFLGCDRVSLAHAATTAAVDRISRDDGWVDVDAQYVASYWTYSSTHLCSSTVCTAGVHSSTSHEPTNTNTNTLIDFTCTRSHTLATQPIRDSLYCWPENISSLQRTFSPYRVLMMFA